jgi:hypothetical protein
MGDNVTIGGIRRDGSDGELRTIGFRIKHPAYNPRSSSLNDIMILRIYPSSLQPVQGFNNHDRSNPRSR